MIDRFSEIRIVGIDNSRSAFAAPTSEIVNFVLTLSASAPKEWADLFNDEWEHHIYRCKRAAYVNASTLRIECPFAELESRHLPELRRVVAKINYRYGELFERERRELNRRAALDAERSREIEEYGKRIKFD